jgi:PAS domain S-box-containing protein
LIIQDKKALTYSVKSEIPASGRTHHDAENKFSAFFNGAHDAIFLIKEGAIIDCNLKTEVLFGYSREELLGKKLYDLSPSLQPDGTSSIEKAHEKITKTLRGIPQLFEYLQYRKNGTVCETEITLHKVKIENDSLVQAIVCDLTKRREIEAELRYRIDFEKFIACIASRFINLPSDRIDEGIKNTLEDAGMFTGVDRSFAFLFNNSAKVYSVSSEWCNDGVASLLDRNLTIPANSIPWWQDKLSKFEIIRIADVSMLPLEAYGEKEFLTSMGLQSVLCVPLRIEKSLIGFFGFGSVTEKRNWSFETASLLRIVGETISHSLERKQRDNELQRLADQRKRLLELSTSMLTTLQSDEVLQQTLCVLNEIIKYNECCIHLLDGTKGVLRPFLVVDANGNQIESEKEDIPLGEGIVSSVIQSGKAELINNAERDSRSYCYGRNRVREEHVICVPMQAKNKVIGTFSVVRHNNSSFSLGEFELVQLFVGYATIAMENAQLFKQIKISEEKYRKLFEDSRDGVFTSTYDGTIVDINSAGIQMLGYESKEELKNINIGTDLYVYPKQRDEYRQILKNNGYVKDFEVLLLTRGGKTIPCLITSTAYIDDSTGQLYFRGFIRDISREKTLEENLRRTQKMESLGQLAGGIAHDFNNVLGIIQSGLSVLGSKIPGKDSSALKYKDMCEHAVQRGADVARRLLTFSKSDEVNLVPVKIQDIINDLTKVLHHTIEKNITIETALSPNISLTLGDKGQLYQVLLNLCVNARDAINDSPNGTRTGLIRIVVDEVESNSIPTFPVSKVYNKYTRIIVSDNGCGIPEDVVSKIFDPFYTTKSKGTGLGLSIVYGIIQAHKGTIDVISEKGKGTSFMIYLPGVEAENIVSVEVKTEVIQNGNKETILIVEDEEILCILLEEVLTSKGYNVLKATDGSEALNIYKMRRGDIDAVIMDMGLPKLSGQALFLHIKHLKPEEKILLASGYLEEELKNNLFELGAKAYLQKPYKPNEILRAVQKVLQ